MQRRLVRPEDGGIRLADRRQARDEGVVAFDVIARSANLGPNVEMRLFEMRRDVPLIRLPGTSAENIRRHEEARE